MAKQVSNVFIRLGIENFEGIEKLKSAFRELDKSIGPSAASIERSRQAVLAYSTASGNTEQVIKGTIDALKGLQAQTERGSESWAQISADLRAFEQQARRTDNEIEILRRGIANSVQGHAQSRSSIEAHIRSLRDLANQATLSGNTLGRVQQDIGRLEEQLNQTTTSARTSRTALNQALAVNPQAILNQWRAYTANIRDASLSAEDLAEAQRRLNILAGAPRIQERRAIAAQAEITNNPEYQRRFGVEGRAYAEGLPNTTAAFSQRLRELQEDLAITYRGTDAYLALQRELIIVQRDATAATQGLGAALLRDLQADDAVRSQRNLQEVVSTLKNEMSQLDTTTTQGFDQYTRYASDVRNLEEQIARLGRAYNTAATSAKQLSDTTENAVLNRIVNEAAIGRLAAQQRARAEGMQELRQAITTGVQSTPLLLPAAGQTSAPGTGRALSGGARRLSGQTEYTFGPSMPRWASSLWAGPQETPTYGPMPATRGYTASSEAAAQAAQRSGFAYRALAADIRIAQSVGSNSITAIEAQRAAWTRLQNAVDIGSSKYRLAAKRIEELDQRMGRGGPSRLGGRQLAQIGGAAISGGIFGGPEGFLGGVIGGAVGGVGGSFAGAAAGAQIGMMRQQLGVAAKYTAELNLVKTTLAQAVNNQEEYNQALAASRSISKDYTVDLMGTIQGYAQLITATRANNISLAETEKVYRGIIASGVAFGKSQEDIASMVRATVQILSKGKVTAEELRGQLGERLPGAVPKFAEATGRTMAQLEKDLEDGKVSIDDFKKFAIKGFIDYDEAAKKIGAGPEKAGLRLDNALKQMMESYGTFFQTVGAGFQNNLTVVINWANENEKVMKRIMYLIMKITEYQYKYLNPITAPVLGLPELPGTVERGARGLGQANPTTSNLFGDLLRKNPITGPQVLYSDLLSKGKVTARVSLNQERTNKLASIFEMMTADYESLFPKAKVPTIFGQGGSGITPSATQSTDTDAKKEKKAAKEALDTLRGVLAVEEAVFKAGQALQLSRYELSKKLTDMETQNRLAALGTIERETAQALEDRRAKTMQFAEELRALEDKQLEAARALNAAQRLAAKGGDQQAVKEAQANLNLVTTQLNDLVKSKPRFMTAADVATMNALTASTKSRNEELQKTIRLETLRADLQQRGYSAAQVQLQLDIASAEDERRRSLTGVAQLDQIAKINAGYAEMVANLQKIYDLNQANANTFGFREGAQRYVESIGTMREATASLTEQGFKGLEDVIVQLTTTGTANFQAFAASILEQTDCMIIQQLVLKTIMQALGAIGGGGPDRSFATLMAGVNKYSANANGNVFAANGIVPYAMGGVVTRPTLFPFAKGGAIGTGLMGEAGPEAIIPLQRGANGKLGVAGGAGTTNITVNVDASGGTAVSGDEAQAKQLGQVVTAVVQAELIKQRRPGGLLSQ